MHNDFLKLKKENILFSRQICKKLKIQNPKRPKTQITKKTLGWVFLKKRVFSNIVVNNSFYKSGIILNNVKFILLVWYFLSMSLVPLSFWQLFLEKDLIKAPALVDI